MTNYSRLGTFLLSEKLTDDPMGSIHRGIATVGNVFDRHVLVRTFSDELIKSGLANKLPETNKNLPLLGGSKSFGLGYRLEGGAHAHIACDYIPGRSLAQLIEKAKAEQIPFGVDHALTVLQGIAQGIIQLHSKGLSHGVLSPHSVWVSFEGAVQILDVPFASMVRSLSSKLPTLKASLDNYLQMPNAAPLHQDLFALGAILYEMLTFDRLPAGGDLTGSVQRAMLKAAQEDDSPVPAELQQLLFRLLLPNQPFATPEAFNAELERVLYDGDYSPTTFNMAFFMHTLFREENERDAVAIKAEQVDNFAAFAAAEGALAVGASEMDASGAEAPVKVSKNLLVGAVVAMLAVGGGIGFMMYQKNVMLQEQTKQMKELQAKMDQMEQKSQDLKKQEDAKLAEIKDLEQRKNITAAEKKKLEDAKAESARLAKEREDLEKVKAQTKAAVESTQAALAKKVDPPKQPEAQPQPLPPPVKPPEPVKQPVSQPQPQPEVKQPEIKQPEVKQPEIKQPEIKQPAVAQVADTPVEVLQQVAPRTPPMASRMPNMRGTRQTVSLRVFVDEAGNPLTVKVAEAPEGGGLADAAIEAAKSSKFKPATRNGQPRKEWINMNFTFVIPKR